MNRGSSPGGGLLHELVESERTRGKQGQMELGCSFRENMIDSFAKTFGVYTVIRAQMVGQRNFRLVGNSEGRSERFEIQIRNLKQYSSNRKKATTVFDGV